MTRRQVVDERWRFVQDVYLPVFEDGPEFPDGDGIYAPPSRVLSVKVVGERAYVAVDKYEETHDTTTTTHIVAECVSAEALLNALCMQMGVEYHQGVIRERGSERSTAPLTGGSRSTEQDRLTHNAPLPEVQS